MARIASPNSSQETYQIVAQRILPLLALCYFLSYLDRTNVSVAALTMNADLGISASAFGLGAGLFFIGYFIFEAIQMRAPTLYMIRLLGTTIDGAVVPGEDVTGDCGRI